MKTASFESNAVLPESNLRCVFRYVLNDGVMGGRSESSVAPDPEGLRFRGTINTRGGGFASVPPSPRTRSPRGHPSRRQQPGAPK